MKTPEQIAERIIERNFEDQGAPEDYSARDNLDYLLQHGEVDADGVHAILAAAIEADRAQRAELVDPDWQDDADMYRDAAAVDISWRAWDASGRQIGYSDAGINGAQAAAMFEAIGRLEA